MPSPFENLDDFIRHPRVTGLALSPDGTRLVATVQEPDDQLARYRTALWDIDPDGQRDPRRLTFSEQGESAPAFTADGDLLFVSSRPDGDDSALWALPPTGEPRRIATSPGGLGSPISRSGVTLATGSRLVGSADADEDATRRKARKDAGITAILHDGMPIRFWDHELDETSPRIFVISSDEGVRDLVPDAGQRLRNTDLDLAPDGSFALVVFSERLRGGRTHKSLHRVDVATGQRSVVLDEPEVNTASPVIDPAGERFAVHRSVRGTYDTPHREWLEVRSLAADAAPVRVVTGDLTPGGALWTVDGAELLVFGDLHGAGAVLAIDPATGEVLRTIVDDASYSSVIAHPDGVSLVALRTAMDRPATPVRFALSRPVPSAGLEARGAAAPGGAPVRPAVPSDGLEARGGAATGLPSGGPASVTFLPAPGAIGELPGTVRRVSTDVDGVEVPGWLFVPNERPGVDAPQLMTWIHGGPFSSWNAWSWRWCPWLAVERGYAVLLPDPALSTGYGDGAIARAWPHRAGIVWHEIEGLLDAVLAADTSFDPSTLSLLGASFGGYMTNWIAGHTDRFRCIVTHAGLWSLDQQHDTTDNAEGKNGMFETEASQPQWYADNSPDRTQDRIVTPMLLIHGNRDYRVPLSEALRAWWDLVSGFDGAPEDMPHRFLELPGENHWVLRPSNHRVWNETVFGFVDQHVRGAARLGLRID